MYVQVITYSLEGISEDGYLDVANGLAPRFAGLPGLLAKIWLENAGGNRYGAVYFWEDVESMERFANSDLFEGGTPEFGDLVTEEFGVLENLTVMTQPVLEIIEPRRAAAPSPPPKTTKAVQGVAAKRTPPARKAPAVKAPAKKVTAKATAKKAAAKAPAASKTAAKAPAKKVTKRTVR